MKKIAIDVRNRVRELYLAGFCRYRISKLLGICERSVLNILKSQGINPPKGDYRKWDSEEIKVLRELFPNPFTPREEIIQKLPKRSWCSIFAKARSLGLHRTKYTEE